MRRAAIGVLVFGTIAVLAAGSPAAAAGTISASASTRILAPLAGGDLAATTAWAIGLSPDGSTLYAAEFGLDSIRAIDLATGTGVSAWTPGARLYSLAVSPDGAHVYAAGSWSDTVEAVDVSGPPTHVAGLGVGREPSAIVTAADGTVYVAHRGDDTIMSVDAALLTPTFFAAGSIPTGLALSPTSPTLAVTQAGTETVEFFTLTGSSLGSAPVAGSPWFAAYSPDGATLWVASYGADTVTPVDVATVTAGAPITVGAGPAGLAVSPDGRWLYVMVDTGSAYVVVDTATRAVVSSMPARLANPFSLAMRPDGSRLYSGSGGPADIAVLDPAELRLTFVAPDRVDPGTAAFDVQTSLVDGLPVNGDYSNGTLLVEVLDAASTVVASSSGAPAPDPVTGAATVSAPLSGVPEGTYSLRTTWSNGGTTLVATAAGFDIAALLPPTGADAGTITGLAVTLVLAGGLALALGLRGSRVRQN